MNLIQKISEQAPKLLEQDLDEWIVPELSEHYSSKIRSLAVHAYGRQSISSESSLALQAFKERAKAELRTGMKTFLFVSQHWRSNRDINSYILTCLNRLANRVKADANSIKKVNNPICPACRIYGQRECLRYEGKLLRCDICSSKISEIEDRINSEHNSIILSALKSELRLRLVFSVHSRNGFRCPACEKFIPDSYFKRYGVSCPYDDCSWFGDGESDYPEIMVHPLGLNVHHNFSLNDSLGSRNGFEIGSGSSTSNSEWLDRLVTTDVNPEEHILINQEYDKELNTLLEVINDQIDSIKRNEAQDKSIQKLLMYQSYKNIINQSPEDMVGYLVHMKHSNVGSPIQSRIFQEYIKLIENNIPFNISRGNKQAAEVCSLLDQNLGLFLGHSDFEATIRKDHVIPNNTVETYTGGRKLKFFGPCFIGMLIDVVDRNTGESLKSKVKYYTFVQIKMDDDVAIGLPVTVSHFRIPSHYEMMHLVHLQRIRRSIVDSVYFRLNKHKRPIE
jgi:hypothetical protein